MKKLFSLVCVGLLLLSGCGSSSDKNSTGTDDKIVVGMECNYAPFNWTQLDDSNGAIKIDNTEGYCAGYDVEIAKLIAEDLGKDLVIKKWPDFDALPSAANIGEIDLIIAGMSPTAERKETIDFSEPYYFSDIVLVVRKDSDLAKASSLGDFSGVKVAGQLGTFHLDLINQIDGVTPTTPLSDFPTLTVAVKSNDIDAFVSEKPVAIAIVANNPDLTYVEFAEGKGFELEGEDETQLSVAVGIKKGREDILNSINKTLTGGIDFDKLMTQAIKDQPEAGE